MTPEGLCPVCHRYNFVDGALTSRGGRIRGHYELGASKSRGRPADCAGTGQPGTDLRWPNGDPYLGLDAAVRLQWPGGRVYWEGP